MKMKQLDNRSIAQLSKLNRRILRFIWLDIHINNESTIKEIKNTLDKGNALVTHLDKFINWFKDHAELHDLCSSFEIQSKIIVKRMKNIKDRTGVIYRVKQ